MQSFVKQRGQVTKSLVESVRILRKKRGGESTRKDGIAEEGIAENGVEKTRVGESRKKGANERDITD